MSEIDHERWSEDLPAYLLGALEPGEQAELERHVEGCDDCRAELDWLRPTVNLLPETVERVEPPADLRARIVGQARSEARPAKAARARRPLFRGWRPVAGLATVALVLAVVAGYAIRDGESGGGEAATTVATAGKAPGVTAKMIGEGDKGTLRLANVKQLPPERVLEAWIQRDGEVTPVRALFVPDGSGHASTTIPDTRGVEVVMVTAEPQGGSESPTAAPMVTLEMPQ